VIAKPPGLDHPDHAVLAKELVQTVKSMAEVKVVRRWARLRRAPKPAEGVVPLLPQSQERLYPPKLVAIGTSTGGPIALQTLLFALPHPFPAPIVIVQHMATGFVSGF